MKINEKIIKIRVDLQNAGLDKGGKNKGTGVKYFELADFLPKLNELMNENSVCDNYTIENGEAVLTLISEEEKMEYKIPFYNFEVPLSKAGSPTMQQIQYLGALNTYYKRYLYMNAFGITDGDIIESMEPTELPKKENVAVQKKENVAVVNKELKEAQNNLKQVVKEKCFNFGEVATTYSITKETTSEELNKITNLIKSMPKKEEVKDVS